MSGNVQLNIKSNDKTELSNIGINKKISIYTLGWP